MSLAAVKQTPNVNTSRWTQYQKEILDDLEANFSYKLSEDEKEEFFRQYDNCGMAYNGGDNITAMLRNNAKVESLYKILYLSGIEGVDMIAHPSSSNQWIARETTVNAIKKTQ